MLKLQFDKMVCRNIEAKNDDVRMEKGNLHKIVR